MCLRCSLYREYEAGMVWDMSYRIVVDSCGEFTEEMEWDPHFEHVALRLDRKSTRLNSSHSDRYLMTSSA